LSGPAAASLLTELAGEDVPALADSSWCHAETVLEGYPVWMTVDPRAGRLAWTLWSTPEAVAALRRWLVERETLEVGPEAREALRLESGSPIFGIDYGPDNLPQESGLTDAVSYTKGCYLGQEVVARLHYRGQVARRLARLHGPDSEPPAPGTAVLLEGREAGVVTSVARSPSDGSTRMWAMLKRRALEVGTRLEVGGRMVEVVG
jgi:folate-binding protein YgfZ